MTPRQRQGLLVLALTVVGVVLTFLALVRYTQNVAQQLGPLTDVVVVARDIPPHAPIAAEDLETIEVPAVFAPAQVLTSVEDVGERVSPVPLPVGTVLQEPALVDPPALVFGERAITVFADGQTSLGGSIAVDDIVDIVAAYDEAAGVTTTVEVAEARVLAVLRPDSDEIGRYVTVAVPEADVPAIARAQAAADAIVIARLSPVEVGR